MNLLNKKGIVVRNLPRHDAATLQQFATAGVQRFMKRTIGRD